MTGDAMAGAIVEARAYEDAAGRKRLLLATRSDLTVEAQVTANGATWLDRQLLAREHATSGGGFGAEVRDAMYRHIVSSSAHGQTPPPVPWCGLSCYLILLNCRR